MSSQKDLSPEEIFYDSSANFEDQAASQNDVDKKHVYFELENHPCSSDEEETLRREDKFKTARGDMQGDMAAFKRDSLQNANISVANRLKMFEQGASKDTPPGQSPKNVQNAESESKPKAGGANTFPAGYYDKVWEGQSGGGNNDIYEEYSVAGPFSPRVEGKQAKPSQNPFSTAAKTSSSSSTPSSSSLLTNSSSQLDKNQPNEDDDENIYSVAVCPPFPITPQQSPKTKEQSGGMSTFYLSTPVPVYSPTSSLSSVEGLKPSANRGCQEGTGAAVPVDFMHPVKDNNDNDESEYTKLYFKSTGPGPTEKHMTASLRQRLKERGYSSMNSVKMADPNRKASKSGASFDDSDMSEDDDTSLDWGSEFDDFSYQESIDDLFEGGSPKPGEDSSNLPDKPLPPKPSKGKFAYQDLIPKPLRPTSNSDQFENVDLTSSAVCLPVKINPNKHPPPRLPDEPEGLTDAQKKRRCVIDLIISSEKSYVDSLERILKQYEKVILDAIPNPKARLRVVFSVTREIISHHKMFQIELSEAATTWDDEEKIGDIFTASFSKTMVVNAYSAYVNNFSAAMEEIRTAQRNKQSFDDFLREREKSNSDRLSIFGLMVKPVQRFPQFIMCLQDLIKYLPSDHHDRRALQLALTELENVTHMLNERKRCSEQRFQALQTIHQLIRQKAKHMLTGWNLDMNTSRRLIRYDTVEQVFGEFETMKCKDRRLILMNDLVICVKVIEKEQSGFRVERLGLRWIAKLKDLELKDTAITPDMHSIVKREPGKIHIISSQLDHQAGGDKTEEDPFHLYADLSEMLHDYTVLGQVSSLVSTLKRSYNGYGLSEELVHEITRDLQRMIQIKDEQLRLVNSCSIVLVDTSRSDKPQYVIQTQTAAIKQDWSVDFLMAKLALDRSNNPAWERTIAGDDLEFDLMPAHFMKQVAVDVPRNYTKTKCAVSVFLNPEKTSGLGVQHLWVCSSNETRGQVSVLSIHNSKPALTESFRACDCDILSVDLVPGCGDETSPDKFLFVEDTVWMTTCNKDILVFPLTSSCGVRRDPLVSIKTSAVVSSIRFVDERVFCGMDNGCVSVYSRESDGAWNVTQPTILTFGLSSVRIHFVWEEDLWLSCGNNLYVVEIDSLETTIDKVLHGDHEILIDHVVRAGMGIWVSFTNSAFIKLFHVETLENLQEMSIGNFLQRIAAEKLWTLNPITEDLKVTSLESSKGYLWIGTNLGVVLTLTLPRLSDGVPLYRGRPSVSLHAHRGPVKFLIPLICASNTMELKRSSTLRSTLMSRPSKRNMERERLELEESEKRLSSASSDMKEDDSINTQPEATGEASACHNGSSGESNNEDVGNVAESNNDAEDIYQNFSSFAASSQDDDLRREEQDTVWTSFDDDPYALRKRASREYSSMKVGKGRNLSFRSELAQRIRLQTRRMSGSCNDLSYTKPLEIEELYETLLEEDESHMDRLGTSDPGDGPGMRHTLSNFRTSYLQNMSPSPLQQVKDTQNSATSSSSDFPRKDRKFSQPDTKIESKPLPSSVSTPSLSVRREGGGKKKSKTTTKSSNSNARDLNQSRLGRTNTMRGTLRKSGGNNAVIVLSGGDGYRDLNSSRNQTRSDDACIMLWMYKF